MRSFFRPAVDPLPDPQQPIRTELFSVERLEQHGESLAAAQQVTADPGRGRPLLPRLVENGRVLLASYRNIAETTREESATTPAAGWLLDNFHIVDEQLRQIREDLPRGFYLKLPKLAAGFLAGYPRVFGIAWAFVAHTDSRFEPEALRRFVQAYQRVQPLTIGELWAVAITLRIVMVENLRRLSEQLVSGRAARRDADALADRLLGLGGRRSPDPSAELAPFAQGELPTAFAVQLVQRLREHDPDLVPALRWLEDKLASQGTTSEEIVRLEHHDQAAMNVTVRNLITSMRLMSTIDWKEFFESVSPVDEVLRAATNFAALDFATRDVYRHAIEDLARGSQSTEVEVARWVVAEAKGAAATVATAERRGDPGFYLIEQGRAEIEREIGFRVPPGRRLARAYVRWALPAYVSTVVLTSALVLLAPMVYAALAGAGPLLLLLLAALAFVPTTDLAVALANLGVVQRIGPRPLAKLELRGGVPAELRTLVAIPALLGSEAEVDELVGRLEVHHLANPDRELCFALVSDWADAPSETMPGDERLVLRAADGIARLNALHGDPGGDVERFHLFHRARRWNPGEGRWMGWERKRGKLHELNRLLRAATDTSFVAVAGQAPRPPAGVRYVITLDSDTRLPVGAARALIGAMAHPLNRPRFDAALGRVVEGYGVLQPRVSPTLPPDRGGSLYQWISSGPCGIDPYVSAVSDVYQDLFGEGSYTGKGIYDVDAFEAALAGRVPDDAMLSHDLFEGVFARSGLATEISFFEAFPTHYQESVLRQHRWARGDWQLLPWVFGSRRDGVPFLGRWKMADNLRRTLSAPMAVLTLLAAWLAGGEIAVLWTQFVVLVIALPPLLPLIGAAVPSRRGISKRSHLRGVGADLLSGVLLVALTLTMLAHHAAVMTDAIVRTLIRLFVTRRRLLEWVTAAQARLSLSLDLRGFYLRMRAAVGLAIVVAVLVVAVQPGSWLLAAPFLLLWVLSPVVAQRISLPLRGAGQEPLTERDAAVLRLAARRTWHFFVTFVGADDNGLPPDNFQEDPKPVVAHRTSPTNIGLYCLSTIAARDFAWIGALETVERLEATFATLARLERFRGHLYNWYDTRTLAPLEPPYVSSVDSGNLAGNLIVVAQACQAMVDRPLLGASVAVGLRDALGLVREATAAITDDRRTETVNRRQLDDAVDALASALEATPETPAAWRRWLGEVDVLGRTLVDVAGTFDIERGDGAAGELLEWSRALSASVASHARDLEELLPWSCADLAGAASPALLDTVPAPSEMSDRRALVLAARPNDAAATACDADLEVLLESSADACATLVRRLLALGRAARDLFEAMRFDFLLDSSRDLLTIGYRVREGELDPSCYDLLASEARLASFIAIAKGDVPTSHWFHLGRSMTPVDRGAALISWSGSMFEYLMPVLVMDAPPGSLLEQTCRFVVRRQIAYGASRGVPWGVSESAFNARDLELTYQYSNFGVPGLGLKRGLSEDLVVAPYATALAAMIDPRAAVVNLDRLAALGARGRYGFLEALDYTATRLPEGATMGLVHAYMAHHQGMTVVAIANVLHDGIMRARFHAEPIVKAADLLLQERAPRDVAVSRPRAEEVRAAAHVRDLGSPVVRRFTSVHEATPRTHLLSGERYAVMITTAGSGYSRWGDLAITRWRGDTTRDAHGQYVFLRDTDSGEVWSAGYQPSAAEPDSYEAVFSEDRAEIRRRDGAIATTLEVVVSPEDDAEVRRVTITNHGSRTRQIELTSYAEIVLATPAADQAHPVFSNLFVQTEAHPALHTLLATRRPRSPEDRPAWAGHVVTVDEHLVGGFQCETDRARFLFRGRGIRTPMSVIDGRPLSNTAGSVLDPIFSLRARVRLVSGTSARVTFSTVVGASRAAVVDLADKYRDPATFERVVTLARTESQVQLRHVGIALDEAHLFQRLAGRVLYAESSLRPPPDVLQRASGGAAGLWPHGISGDLPIVLVRIDDTGDQEIVHQLLRAHEYWRLKQLAVDLVIVNEQGTSYLPELQDALERLVRASQSRLGALGVPGNVFILRGDRLTAEDRLLLQTSARAVLLSRHGTLAEQVSRVERPQPDPIAAPARRAAARHEADHAPLRPDLELFNGLGGFAADGREYVTVLGEGQWTPAPWLNVIANPSFGFQVSESGSGYTWSVNSRENQLTAWSNDPVSDPSGEVLYVRDEDSGALWGPTVLPIREESTPYVVRHGQGYSRFAHDSHGIELDLLQFVPRADSVKISRLELTNRSGRTRRLSVTAYVEWVLGTSREASAPHVITEMDAASGAILVRNPWNGEFAGRVAFADLGGRLSAWTCDRTEFLGRNATLDHPLALERGRPLAGTAGPGLDPCSALQTTIELRDGASATVVFLLGEADDGEAARALVARYREADLDAVLAEVTTHWDDVLGCVQVKTPDRSMDLMLNRWLLYQVLACRVWARAAFYQAGGAYGFRDQLQDVMALTVSQRALAREHLLRAARRQFVEGDVQHWWHPPSGRGTRTRISDDLAWLPYAVNHYLEVTADLAVLDESLPFLDGPVLADGQGEAYFEPAVASEQASLYEHCARALDRSLRVGRHGLPLMGGGDWNDGMNRVGHGGQGESVWLGWFLHTVLWQFARWADLRGEHERATTWRRHLAALQVALEREAWDGDWYRRAFFDDGTPLGSIGNEECRIDSIAQSWAVISGAAERARATRAMAAVEEYLVRRGDGLVLLFAPPFNHPARDPGYIQGYLPGVRENGGQYTHAAIWSVLAYAALGDGDKAGDLFAILNPVNHTSTRAGVHRYKVEPYVAAADVYAEPPHVGRGGWTWYTGSAGWMYRAGIEWILGFRVRGATLNIDPCIPRAWPRYEITFRYHSTRYEIVVENPHGATRGVALVELDGDRLANGAEIAMVDDARTHHLRVVLGTE